MLHAISSFARRAATLGAVLVLAACVITTEKAYFDDADFEQPRVLSGDWVSVPSEPGDEILKIRIAVHGNLWRAQPLTEAGEIDKSEDPVDFGIVQLAPGEYILVQSDGKAGEGPINYLGLRTEDNTLSFFLFNGGTSDGGTAKFASLVTSLGMTLDASFSYEARLAGDISADRLKDLFKALLADPAAYDGYPSVYQRIGS